MINVGIIYRNLRAQMEKKADKNYIELLKSIINYSEENKFRDLNKLVSAIKYSSESDEMVYCITTLNKIKQVIELNEPPIAETEVSVTVEEYMDWLLENKKPVRKKTSRLKNKMELVKIKSKPLKLSNEIYYDWIELDINLELTRYVCK